MYLSFFVHKTVYIHLNHRLKKLGFTAVVSLIPWLEVPLNHSSSLEDYVYDILHGCLLLSWQPACYYPTPSAEHINMSHLLGHIFRRLRTDVGIRTIIQSATLQPCYPFFFYDRCHILYPHVEFMAWKKVSQLLACPSNYLQSNLVNPCFFKIRIPYNQYIVSGNLFYHFLFKLIQ